MLAGHAGDAEPLEDGRGALAGEALAREAAGSASTTLSITVRPSKSEGICVLMPTPSRAIAKLPRPGDVAAAPEDAARPWA